MDVFPDNTLSHFLVKLPQTITLEGSWEVALMEIHYPHSWYNVVAGKNRILYDATMGSEDHGIITLDAGYYHSIDSVIEAIRSKGLPDTISMVYNDTSKRVTVGLGPGAALFPFEGMAEMLGFPRRAIHNTQVAPFQADIRTIYSLYVYSDLVEEQLVGDVRAPLLRIVNVEGENSDIITHAYNKPYFLPLKKREFDTIEIYIRDDTGQKVPFQRGKVIVTLAFRKRRPTL